MSGLVLLLAACRHEGKQADFKDASPYFTAFFPKEENGVLRGIQFNMQEDDVKKMEKSKLYETTPDHLFYEFSYPKDSTEFEEYANVQYFFDENGKLDIITTDIFLNDSMQEEKLKSDILRYFGALYGKSHTDDYDYDVWDAVYEDRKNGKQYNYTIALKGLDNDYGISLEYMRE